MQNIFHAILILYQIDHALKVMCIFLTKEKVVNVVEIIYTEKNLASRSRGPRRRHFEVSRLL